MSRKILRILLAQVSPYIADKEKNLAKMEKILSSADDVDVAVFPELYLTGYLARDTLHRLAIDIESSKEIEKLRRLSSETGSAIVVGAPVRSKLGFLYNAAIAVDGDKLLLYFKRHLPTFSLFEEARWFKAHQGPLTPWRLRGVVMGPAICYDIFFPEIFRAYALMGTVILLVISASPDSSLPLFQVMVNARALENTSYVIWVNTVGTYEGLGFAGGSRIADPLGNTVLQLKEREEDVAVVDVELDQVMKARKVRPVIRDVNPADAAALLRAYREFENWQEGAFLT